MNPSPPPITICIRSSGIHGQGGFAAADIREGACLVEYTGEKITKSESLERCRLHNEYLFYLDETHDLDGNLESNLARFINHSCVPNCEAVLIGGHIWIAAIRDLRAGEELTFDYGYDLEDFREYPCHCGAPNCRGYIVAAELAPANSAVPPAPAVLSS